MKVQNKIRIARVVQHLKNKPKDHNRKIHSYALLIITCLITNGFAWLTYGELAKASVISIENHSPKGWDSRQEPEKVDDTLSTGRDEDGILVDKGVIGKIAQETGINWKILKAICIKESGCKLGKPGDSGVSHGYFQMNQIWNPGTIKCAEDFECSARWTANRLKRHAHLGEWEMIRSHNGLVGDRDGDGEVDNAYYPRDVYEIMKTL